MQIDEFFQLMEEELPEDYIEFFERVHEGYKMGETPSEVADDLYFVVEEEGADISHVLVMATVLGVVMSNTVPIETEDND